MDCEATVLQQYNNINNTTNNSNLNNSTNNTLLSNLNQTVKKSEENPLLMQAIRKISDKGNVQVDLTENELIKDVIFAFQGIDGHYISFSQQDDCFQLKSNIPVSEPVRSMVNKLCELGWLFKKVQDFTSGGAIRKEPLGLINQSLYAAIQEELIEYYRLIAILENLRSQSCPIKPMQ